jgi:hypothetical protein
LFSPPLTEIAKAPRAVLSCLVLSGLLTGALGCRLDLSQDRSEAFATSCGYMGKDDPPEVSDVINSRITVEVGGPAYALTTCFYHDQWRTVDAYR